MSDTPYDGDYLQRPAADKIKPRVSSRSGLDDGSFQRNETARMQRLKPTTASNYFDQMRYGLEGASPGGVDDYVRTNYPYLAAFLDNAELGPILRRAALEGWDEGRLYGAVQQTGWWRQTSAADRTWQALVNEDPAEAARLAGQTAATVQNRARSLGLNLKSGDIQAIASTATRNGWTDSQVIDELIRNVNWSQVAGGDLTAMRDSVKRIGADYFVNVSDATAQSYATAIASGEMSEAGVASIMQRQAKTRFGWMADEIDQGVTPSQYFMPVRDVVANELGLAPEAVNMMDSQWLGVIERRDESGKTRAATLDEARLAARKDSRYQNTQNAQELAAKAGAAIRDVFGRRSI